MMIKVSFGSCLDRHFVLEQFRQSGALRGALRRGLQQHHGPSTHDRFPKVARCSPRGHRSGLLDPPIEWPSSDFPLLRFALARDRPLQTVVETSGETADTQCDGWNR